MVQAPSPPVVILVANWPQHRRGPSWSHCIYLDALFVWERQQGLGELRLEEAQRGSLTLHWLLRMGNIALFPFLQES